MSNNGNVSRNENSVFESTKPIQNARDYLISIYLDYVNNYLTEEKWAEHNGLELSQAKKLLDIATIVRGMPHPEA